MLIPVVPIGNSRGIRLPKLELDKFLVKDKLNMEVTEKGILLTPVNDAPRSNRAEPFRKMHENKDDVLEEMPVSGDFEWDW